MHLARNAIWYTYFWIKGNILILYGVWLILKLPKPRVTIYGGRFVKNNSIPGRAAAHLASLCAQHHISVLTGGGPGIMDAAACSVNGRSKTLGITVRGLEKLEAVSLCNDRLIFLLSFPARKWLLREFSQGFVVFPGGIGTLDEFTELMMLMQLGQLKRSPIVLFGSAYWHQFLEWFYNTAINEGTITPDVRDYFIVTDDPEEAFILLFEACKKHRMHL